MASLRAATRSNVAHPADLDRLEYLRFELESLHAELSAMVASKSWQAVVNGRRLALQMRAEIESIENEKAAHFDPNDLDSIVTTVLAMPDSVFADPRVIERVERCR